MNRTVISISVLSVVLCLGCLTAAGRAGAAVSTQATNPESQAVSVVARIGAHAITKDELVQKLLQEIRPHEEEFHQESAPVTAETALRKILADKAMSMEGRRLGYLSDEQIHTSIVQFEQQQIVRKLLETQIGDKLSVEDAEIEQVIKENPKATREQAKMFVQRTKAVRLMEQFYAEVTAKRKLQKVAENLPKAVEIHQRLLTQPRAPRGPSEYWIRNSQLSTDLSDQEKNLTLATFEGGQFTLKDWFVSLCNIAPPRRPKDLDTAQGVEKLLDMALRAPVLAAEARSRGYDKDPKVRQDVRNLEDQRLLYKVQEKKTEGIKEPTPEQTKACFDKNPERFATNPVLKVDQIWCPDEAVARKVKATLEDGGDFQAVKSEHSLEKNVSVYSLSPGSEGPFWAELWKAEPNQVLGPVKGFHGNGAKWRVVKILEKTPAQPQAYTEQLGNSIKWTLFGDQRQQALRAYEKELLEKYPHEIYFDRIKDLDPVDLAMEQRDQ